MLRVVTLTVPSRDAEALVDRLKETAGLLSLRHERQVSVVPLGDVITVEIANRGLQDLMRLLDSQEIGIRDGTSRTISAPSGYVSRAHGTTVANDINEATWDEMALMIGRESNMTISASIVMGIAGVLAATGIVTGALHVVIAAMVIAPGFEPLARVPLALVAGSAGWKRGLADALRAYVALGLGAVAVALLLKALGHPLLPGGATYLTSSGLVHYWTSLTVPSLLVWAAGAVSGALLITIDRAVLTAGVMIALALVPAFALVPVGVVAGDFSVAAQGLLLWTVNAALVIAGSAAVFAWKQYTVHRRRMLL